MSNHPPHATGRLNQRSGHLAQWLLLFAIILYGIVIEWLFGWKHVLSTWQNIPLWYPVVALMLMFLTYVIRGWRIYDFFLPVTRGGLVTCCKIMLSHNLLNNLLPMRTGEISFPLLMRRYFGTGLGYATAGLLLLRILDLQVLLGLGYLALLLVWHSTSLWLWGLLILWFIAPLLLLWLAPWLESYAKSLKHGRIRWLLEQLVMAMPAHAGSLARSWLLTWICWVSKIMVFAVVLGWFMPLAWWNAVGVSIGGELSSVLPVHAPAGLGTYEASMLAAGKLLGMQVKGLLFAGIQLHLLMLVSTLFGGVVALLIPARQVER
ncbi:lysylphosphatidylglycerol synthase domain-containing protein [Acinetobacter sp. WZC-1]|uniref:lysylphosphatidylglycerol synthase domain-containing protein n=1 Tax=Acinetobacter sp. WZC-1 TaxID=3459034 RepID=UPI00403D6816